MLRNLFLTVAIAAAVLGCRALTAVEAFETAPASVFPTLDRLTRLDMVDYFNAGSDRPSRNKLQGQARILSIAPEMLTVETSAVATHTIHLLPRKAKADTIIMLISTLKTPTEDSAVKFFTSSWQPIKRGLFMSPELSDFVSPRHRSQMADIENASPYTLATATYDPGSSTLTITNNLSDWLPSDVSAMMQPVMVPKLQYRWNGKSMVKIK